MKSLLLTFLGLLTLGRLAAQPVPTDASVDSLTTWAIDWQTTQQAAETLGQPILLLFAGSDWCRPCMQWEREVFDKEAFTAWAEGKVQTYRADFPRKKKNRLSPEKELQHGELAATYNPKGLFPYCLLLSPSGEVITATGYLPGGLSSFTRWADRILTSYADAPHE